MTQECCFRSPFIFERIVFFPLRVCIAIDVSDSFSLYIIKKKSFLQIGMQVISGGSSYFFLKIEEANHLAKVLHSILNGDWNCVLSDGREMSSISSVVVGVDQVSHDDQIIRRYQVSKDLVLNQSAYEKYPASFRFLDGGSTTILMMRSELLELRGGLACTLAALDKY